MVGGIASLIASLKIAKYLKKFHSYPFTLFITLLEIASLLLFAYFKNPYSLAFFFVTHLVLQSLLYVCLNLFVESFSQYARIGSIRGMFLTIFNLGILVSPLIGGRILASYSFEAVYLVATLTLIPFILLSKHYLSHIKEPAYKNVDMLSALKKVRANKGLKGVLIAALITECFYAVMVIYSPLYLQSIGIPLTTYLSSIMPFVLIPLVLLPYELGFLADTKLGEKEILIGGLLLLALTVFLCVIIKTTNPLVWVAVLLTSRIGAACVETMSFTYYFKKIDKEDASLTALFSNTRAVASILVGFIGLAVSPLLTHYPELMFIILGCAILWCISYVTPIKDTL
jgi:drug/metabolite transporter (DMT)-like permease